MSLHPSSCARPWKFQAFPIFSDSSSSRLVSRTRPRTARSTTRRAHPSSQRTHFQRGTAPPSLRRLHSPDWPRDCCSYGRPSTRNITGREAIMTFSKIILCKSVLWTAIALPGFILPAFAQQEVDPTYYDPWAAAPKAVTRPAHPTDHKQAVRKQEPPVARVKETQPKQARQYAARGSDSDPSAGAEVNSATALEGFTPAS